MTRQNRAFNKKTSRGESLPGLRDFICVLYFRGILTVSYFARFVGDVKNKNGSGLILSKR